MVFPLIGFALASYINPFNGEFFIVSHYHQMIPIDWIRIEPMSRKALMIHFPNGDRQCFVFDAGATIEHGIGFNWRCWLRCIVDLTLRSTSDVLETTSVKGIMMEESGESEEEEFPMRSLRSAMQSMQRSATSLPVLFDVKRLFCARIFHCVNDKPVDLFFPAYLKRSLSESDLRCFKKVLPRSGRQSDLRK